MKLLRRITVPALILLFISTGLCFCQDTAQQSRDRGVEYAAQGKLQEAKSEFEKALEPGPFREPAERFIKLRAVTINDGELIEIVDG